MSELEQEGFPFGPLDGPEATPDQAGRNLRGIVLLRTLTVAGQTAAVLIAAGVLGWHLPVAAVTLTIALLAGWNLVTLAYARRGWRPGEAGFFIQLLADVLQLTALLHLTGGAANPFTWFLLLPLTIAATTLGPRATWLMAAVTVACYGTLMLFHEPMATGHGVHDFGLHVVGMWVGFMVSAVLIATFVSGMARNLSLRELALCRAREQALRDEQVVTLGTLAAGTAHELGTPLATILTVAGEVQRAYPAEHHPDLAAQMELVREQVERSRKALATVTAGAMPAGADAVPVRRYLEEVVKAWRRDRPGVPIDTAWEGSADGPPVVAGHTLTQALHNLLNNAADASPERVGLTARWSGGTVTIAIDDDGPGLDGDSAASAMATHRSTKAHGLGLGLLLTHSVIARLGGSTAIRSRPEGGTVVTVKLPVAATA